MTCVNCGRRKYQVPADTADLKAFCCEDDSLDIWTLRDVVVSENLGCTPDELYPPAYINGKLYYAVVAKRMRLAA